VKTTVEIPDAQFRQAKTAAAQQGASLKDLFAEALREQLRRKAGGKPSDRPWMRAFGRLRTLRRENRRLEGVVAAEFERIDVEERH
jgi:hypothetical protein